MFCIGNRRSLIKLCPGVRSGEHTPTSSNRDSKTQDATRLSVCETGHRQEGEQIFASREPPPVCRRDIDVQWASNGGKTSPTIRSRWRLDLHREVARREKNLTLVSG